MSPERGWLTCAVRGSILHLKAEGEYTTRDIQAVLTTAMSDPSVPDPTWLLVDLRSSRWRPTADQVAERVRILGSLQPRLRGSAFVIADPARYGTFVMYQAHAGINGGPLIQVFPTPADAEAWLRIQSGFEPVRVPSMSAS